MSEVVTKSEFARRRGWHPSRVSKLLGRGLPVLADGRIDVVAAEAWCDENLDHARARQWGGRPPAPAATSPSDDEEAGGESLAELRRQRESTRVERDALELRKAKGELVDRADVRRFLFARARMERDSHLAWVTRVAPQLAGELGASPSLLFARLDGMMREHLEHLAGLALPEAPDDALA